MATLRAHHSLMEIPAESWDSLCMAAGRDGRNPFVAHAFLAGLEQTGCIREEWGWTPHHLALWQGDELVAAAPAYLKGNSHGEFVFDHAWAHAYARAGLEYFPKLLIASPYSPVTGPRLPAKDKTARNALLGAIAEHACEFGLSSVHVNFHLEDEDSAFDADEFDKVWLPRSDVQYHWRNDAGWRDFDGFLAALDHKHRKNIRQERAKVAKAGITFRVLHGDEASDDDLAAMFEFYLQTFMEHGNSPALTLDFLRHLAREMPRNLVIFLADLAAEPIAGALCLRGGDTLYGRYWGAHANVSGLHFEACYYQGIEYCLREGLHVFEPGAQGEHKIARGFLPAPVRSRHWIADAQFRDALRRWCEEETRSVHGYARSLLAHSPYRAAPTGK